MKIIIPGGTGQVGSVLARALTRDHHEVVVLGRHPRPAPWRVVQWDPTHVTGWAEELDGADVVINLAGRSVNCRYTPANRDEILRSRVLSVRTVGQAITAARRPPRVWLQASTATIYAHRYDGANDETSGVVGGTEPGAPDTWRFSIEVATAWESALDEAATPGTRKVKLRSAMIMSPDPGGDIRHVTGTRSPRSRRNGRQRSPVCLLDPRSRFCPSHLPDNTARSLRRCRQSGGTASTAE